MGVPTHPLPLLLLITTSIRCGLCQLDIKQDATCTFTPVEWQTTVTAGTNISASCNRVCTQKAVKTNQKTLNGVKGTEVYSLDSDPCLAAIHEARLAYPSRWTEETAPVQLTVVRHQGTFFNSFRRGIPTTRLPSRKDGKDQLGLTFVSNKVMERVSTITAVYKFRFNEGETTTRVKCHIPSAMNRSQIKLFRPTGREYVREVAPYTDDGRGNFKEVVVTKKAGATVVCRKEDMLYSDTTTFGFIKNPYFEPTRLVHRASIGDRIVLGFSSKSSCTPNWYKDGRILTTEGREYSIETADIKDAGLYEMRCDIERNGASETSVIIRGCPADYFGPQCDQRCPFCLHGGQCHDVTGECVCPPSFYGARCETSCEKGMFGADCSSACPKAACSPACPDNADTGCEGHLLCVPEPYGCSCASGYNGTFCNTDCTIGSYGPDCTSSCGKCKGEKGCDRFTGACKDGCEDKFQPPLCLDLSPWFRDLPVLVNAGFTTAKITHAAWRAGYDNGFGSGRYNYTAQYRRDAPTDKWSSGETVRSSQLTGGNVTFTLAGLKADTAYLTRIVIGDEERGTATTDEGKVPAITVKTDCRKPGAIKQVDVKNVTNTSAVMVIGLLANEAEACAYTLHWRLRPASDEGWQEENPGSGSTKVHLSSLSPFTNFTFDASARNRKGAGSELSQTFRTKEAPPSAVLGLVVTRISNLKFNIEWKQPQRPNGDIKRYVVAVDHLRYRACGEEVMGTGRETSQDVNDTSVVISVKHPFSTYSVSVVAVTVSPGPTSYEDFTTEAQAPSAGIGGARETRTDETSIGISWNLPTCTAWNDVLKNLRLQVDVNGTSPWDRGISRTAGFERRAQSSGLVVRLVPYSNYILLLRLNNSVGFSQKPETINVTTRQRRAGPDPPANLTVLTVSSTSITVGWNQPSPPYCRITGYRVTCLGRGCYRRPQMTMREQEACRADDTHGRQCSMKITGLTENTQYTMQVAAYCYDVKRTGQTSEVTGTTQEGKPGPPVDVRREGLELTVLNISWASPVQRNGVILRYQLNISERADSTPDSYVVQTSPQDKPEKRYFQVVSGLSAGTRYLVSVAASTKAGQGNASAVWLETQVPPPDIPGLPEVRDDLTTDTTVQLQLPAVTNTGGGVSQYFVVVSQDPDFDGRQLKTEDGRPYLPNAQEARQRGLSFYVAAAPDQEHVESNGTFVVGDGKHYNTSDKSYYNQPLKTGDTYLIGMAALSKLSDDNQALKFNAVKGLITARAPNAVPTIVGILFAVMLVSLLVIGLVVCRRRLLVSRQEPTPDDLPMGRVTGDQQDVYDPGEPAPDEVIYENLKAIHINQTRIPLSDLIEAIKNSEQLHAQITSLPSGLARPCEYGRLTQNRSKNRYGNLIAYDDSRVVLEKLPGDEFSDYINANYVDGYERPAAYIATQGPKPQTIFDFWRMMWEKRAVRIVMLTNLVEGDKKKCDLYWPEDTPLQMLRLTVHKENEKMSNDYTIRTFSMVRDGERRVVTHLHYTAWPDHSVPLYPSSLAKFMRELDDVPDGGGPTVIHCSAGVGRTGTVILIDAMYKMGRREQAVDVYSHLAVIRQQRANLCANFPQYQLVHQVLVELLVSPSTAVPASQLAARLPQLKSVADGPSQLEQQLTYLDTNPPQVSFASARAEQLEGKNRSPEILPEDKSRVYLHGNLRDNYINAVYVQGFKKPDAFIATEAPLPARRNMFWQMVVQKQSQTIVIMNDLKPEDVFWPTTDEPVTFGNITAQVRNRTPGLVEVIDVTLKIFNNGQMDSSREVRLFLLPFGSTPDSLPAASDIVSLHAAFERSMPNNYGGVTVVVCRTGVTGCGLFIACCFVIARIAEEQEVNVVMAVSTVRKSRPQFIATLKQFELCYDVALAWLDAFDIYSNFQ